MLILHLSLMGMHFITFYKKMSFTFYFAIIVKKKINNKLSNKEGFTNFNSKSKRDYDR